MIDGMRALKERGFKVRTEQITALPTGATQVETATNLDADLGLVRLNVQLRPDIAWASTFAPYKGTKLGQYCERFGFYNGDNSDVPDTFFERSVLKFLNHWVGPGLEQIKDNPSVWLSSADLETYCDRNRELRNHFNFFCLVPQGDKLAESYLRSRAPFSYERLGRETEQHLNRLAEQGDSKAREILANIANLRIQSVKIVEEAGKDPSINTNGEIFALMPYFGTLPKSPLAVRRALSYSKREGLTSKVLSTAIRHHLYEEVLYDVGGVLRNRAVVHERYPSKV